MTGLQAEGVSRRFGEFQAVAPVSFVVEPGRCLVLTGENGSGKSSLLGIAAGRLQPSTGDILLGGEPLREHDARHRRLLSVGLGAPSFYPDLSVRDHLELIAVSHGLGRRAGQRVQDCLARFGAEQLADRMPSSLSSGQTQAVLLAAALARPFEVLILDEPEQRLDDGARLRLGRILREIVDDGAAVLLASHDARLTGTVADQVLELADGVVVEHRGPGAG
jgi:ABC-type multidrug transport system ATPase subunit